jgi:hypothetical protein
MYITDTFPHHHHHKHEDGQEPTTYTINTGTKGKG